MLQTGLCTLGKAASFVNGSTMYTITCRKGEGGHVPMMPPLMSVYVMAFGNKIVLMKAMLSKLTLQSIEKKLNKIECKLDGNII